MLVALSNRPTVRNVLPWAVLALGLVLVVVNVAWMVSRGRPLSAAIDAAPPSAPAPAPVATPDTVALPEGKWKAAGIEVETVRPVTLPAELGVPGRIDANQDRQVVVRPRAAGVVREVKVALGQAVKKGAVLAVLDSADVGTARLNLRAKQRELATVRYEADWKKQIADNVAALIPLLRKRAEGVVIEKQFAGRPLGSFRSTLLDAYAKFDIASHEEEKTSGLRRERIVGEHPAYLATHTREGAQAVFEGAVEQARFETEQQSRVAAQQARLAEAAVIDAAQRLRILGVTEDVDALLAQTPDAAAGKAADEDVTAYPVVAPFDGTVITRSAVVSQKAEINDMLFTVADLSTVWVTANVPESDFGLLPALQQGKIRVSAVAYPGRAFDAKLLSVGATVDPTTRTVPMLAETKNDGGLLKIGMFVRIMLDTSVEAKVLTVPAASVVEIEGAKGVFVPARDEPRAYTFRPVKTGRESGGRLVVASGLADGDSVVSKGAFVLKSELILQNETGDD